MIDTAETTTSTIQQVRTQYPAYKDSGVDWLGEIPAHWISKKAALCFQKIGSGTTPSSGDMRFYDGDINWLQTGDLTDSLINTTSKKITQKAIEIHSTLKIYPKRSLVIAMYGATIGKVGLLNIETTTNQACCVLSYPISIKVEYAFYFFIGAKNYIISQAYGGGQPNISQETIRSLRLPIPLLAEQTRIAEFLDRKTAQIDQAIAQKKRLIELLNERRQVMIHQAVTRGLDPNVPMKDSGIDWIGEIPAHWEVSKLGNYATVNNGTTPSRDNAKYWNNGTVAWVSSGKVNDFIVEHATEFITAKAMRECSLKLFPEGTVLIGIVGQGKTRGTSALLNIPTTINQNLAGIISNKKLGPKFLHNFLISSYKEIRNGNGSNQEALNCRLVASIKIVIPPIDEQLIIVNFIEETRDRIQAAISLKMREIEKLQELKSTLINSAVTGKIKV